MTGRTPLHDAAMLRTLEARARDALGDAFELMRRAGQAAWQEALRAWPHARSIVVACGPGNNGGDGYALARHAHASGREVAVVRLPGHAPRAELAQRACAEYVDAGGRVLDFDGVLPDADLRVDAVFGIGLSRPLEDDVEALVAALNIGGAPLLALDVPTGVDSDSGHVASVAVRADATVQFIAEHAGLRTGAALDHVGTLRVAALDLPARVRDGIVPVAWLLKPAALADALPPRPRDSHKGRYGHVLCIGGDIGTGGAIALCARAALRCGAGLVSVATRSEHVAPLLARDPECMVRGIESADDVAPLLQRATVLAVGPGLGRGAWGTHLFRAALSAGKSCVIDADALALLAQRADATPGDAILTPHPGEAVRLLDRTTDAVQAQRFDAARALCDAFGSAVILKGAGSIVSAPGRTPCVIDAGNPGMATGGMGDVLTGVVAALRAQGLDAFDAATFGALLHGCAGDAAARNGERGLLPSDLFAQLRALANPARAK